MNALYGGVVYVVVFKHKYKIPLMRDHVCIALDGTSAFAAMLEAKFPNRVREGQVFTSIASGLLAAKDAGLSAA